MKKSDDHLFDDDEQEDHIIKNNCARFHGEDYDHRHFKDAVAYLVLRKEGCPRKEALLFASKNCCRVDTTKEKNGPRDYRALKLQETPNYMVQSGWLYGQHDFQLGKCFQPRYSRSYQEALNDDKMEENFNEQEVKMRKEYKKMIKRMKEYVKQINSKYELAEKQGQELIEAVKSIVSGMKKELENRFYLTVNNVRYFDIAETIAHKTALSDEEKNNLIEKLNVFNNLENDQEFTSQQIFKLEADETNTHLIKNNNNNTQTPSNQQSLSEKLLHQPLGKASPWENIGEAQRQQQLASLEESIQYASQLKNLESATKLLEDFDKTEGDELCKPASRFDRTYEIKRKLRQAQMKNNLEMVKEESQAGIEGQFNSQKYFFAHEEKHGGNLQKEQREKEELQNYIFNTYCQAIDDIFQQNFEKFREIQKAKDQKQAYSNSNTQQNKDQISTLKQDSDGNNPSYYSKQARQNMRLASSSLTELDMAAISNLKEKQDSQLVSFKQKVQPLKIFRRTKGIMMQSTRNFHKSALQSGIQSSEMNFLNQSQQNDIFVNPFQGEKKANQSISMLNLSQNMPSSPQNINKYNIPFRNTMGQHIKHNKYSSKLNLKTEPSLGELTKGTTLSGYLPSNQSLSALTPFERFSQLSTKSASQKNISLDLSSGQIQNIEQTSQKLIKKLPLRTRNNFSVSGNSNAVDNLSKKPLALTSQGTRVLKNSYITSSTKIPSSVDFAAQQQCDSQNSFTTSSQQNSQVKGNTINNNNNSNLLQLFTSPANSTKPTFSNELSSAWHLPKHKPADLASIASTPSRQFNRTVHTTATTTHSTAGSIQSFSPPLFKIPNKIKRSNIGN